MTEKIIIIALLLLAIYLYQQNQKLKRLPVSSDSSTRTIFEVEGDHEDLIAEKDLALRQKNEAEAETLSLNNRLKNKQSEVSRKEQEIERLKKEVSQKEIALNKKISEKNGLITTLQREINQQKEKLNTEQLECKKARRLQKKFEEDLLSAQQKVEKLEQQIEELTNRPKSPMPGEFPEEDKTTLEHQHQEQLRKINLLFDPNASDYATIDFNGLYELLKAKVHD